MTDPLFRIHEGRELGNYVVTIDHIEPLDELTGRLAEASEVIGPIACAVSHMHNHTTDLRFVNYPRAKYGERTEHHVRRMAINVAQLLGTHRIRAPYRGNSPRNNVAIVGLNRGYESGEVIEPKTLLDSIHDRTIETAASKEIHVVSVTPDTMYVEPALQLSFKHASILSAICLAADQFDQERFSLEVPKHRRVFMIETPHAGEPDAEGFIEADASTVQCYTLNKPSENR